MNELACPIGRFRPTSDPTMFALDCRGPGSIWTGGLTGHTVVHLIGTIDVYGNMVGNYEEWFYGRYAGDSTQGGLHFKGTFFIDGETMEFFADGKIVDGTCGFAGSTGTFTGEGNSVFGGYTAKWSRPASLVAAEPTCNPVYRDSLPV